MIKYSKLNLKFLTLIIEILIKTKVTKTISYCVKILSSDIKKKDQEHLNYLVHHLL